MCHNKATDLSQDSDSEGLGPMSLHLGHLFTREFDREAGDTQGRPKLPFGQLICGLFLPEIINKTLYMFLLPDIYT